ncbi:restriction endonuclease subunit S [Pseudomonas sp. LARHCG127]
MASSRLTTIGDLLAEDEGDIQTGPFGTKLKASEYTSIGVPVISVGEIGYGRLRLHDRTPRVDSATTDRMPEYVLRSGDIVFARKGAVDRSAQVQPEQDGWFLGSDGIRLRLPPSCNSTFVAYQLQLPGHRAWMLQHAAGSTMPSLNERIVRRIPIVLPKLDEQRAVAAVLSSVDDKIEQSRRTIRALEELAQATFKAWFVDFEPVKAKADGQTSFPGMPSAAFTALPDRLTESTLGLVPQGWDIRPIGDLVSVKGGGTPSTKVAEYWDRGTHFWATPKDLSGLQDPVLLETSRRITEAGAECISSGVLEENTVLLSSRAPVGYTALSKVPVAVNQGFIAMTCDGPLPPHYVLHWTRSMLGEIKSRASGTTFPEISKGAFRPIPAILPSAVVLRAFESFTANLFDLIEANARQRSSLKEMRDYLLPRLLSGVVKVRL